MPIITPDSPVLIVAGTNRRGSHALNLAKRLATHYGDTPCEVMALETLPTEIFHPDAYATKPASFKPFQDKVLAAAGLHLVVPEYNGGYPGSLKLFIDLLKFPDSFEGKPVCFVGESAGAYGAMRPIEQLQMVFAYRNAYLAPFRVFVPGVARAVADDGTINDPEIDARLKRQATDFAAFVRKL